MIVSRRSLLGLFGGGAALAVTQVAGASPALAVGQSKKSGDYRLVGSDAGKALDFMRDGGTTICSIPTDGSAPAIGAVVEIAQRGTASLRVVADSGVTLLPGSPQVSAGRYSVIGLRHCDQNTWLVCGGIA